MKFPVLGLVRRVHPHLGWQKRPVLGVEPPVKTGGAVFAMSAASMGMVPLPQKGSQKGSRPR